jgi:hypothetical protein
MKTIFILTTVVILTACVSSRQASDNSASQLTKEQKKELKLAKEQHEYDSISNLIDQKAFVLEANFLSNRWGRRIWVNNTLNFISVDSINGILQIGSNWGLGPNGVGGVTAKGKISSWKVKKNDKKKTLYLSFNVMSPIGIYDVHMDISGSGYTRADVMGLYGGQLTYEGNLIPITESKVYKGHSL